MKTILIAFVFAAMAHAGCVAVSSDRILARDVSAALPFLQGLNPETELGFAPRPGVQRVLSARDLVLIARKHGLELSDSIISGICVERMTRSISPVDMRSALLSAMGSTDVELELLEFSREPFPPGQLEFKPAQLGRPLGDNAEIPVIWHGVLRYDLQRSLPVWAKIRVSVRCMLLVASENIPSGTAIDAAQIKEISGRQFPFPRLPAPTPAAIIGKIARRTIAAGQRFAPDALDEPTEISKGDTVHVSVVDGSATLSLEAVAQSSAKKGETILVHNPSTGKSFHAVVEVKGKVTVRSSPGA